MKKPLSTRVPRKLVLRGEAIAQLTLAQLVHVAGASVLAACSVQSNQQDGLCPTTDTAT